ncbi:MAG: hypothetical protein ACE5GW_11620 [Planctomycetota bacterium]
MANTDRPSGLTALAVINFVFAAFELLGAIGLIVIFAASSFIAANTAEERDREMMEQFGSVSFSSAALLVGLQFLSVIFLVASGIGYLGQRRLLGRWGGNGYAAVALLIVAAVFGLMPPAIGERQSIGIVSAFFYPLFTLALVNGVFRRDLVR